LEKLDSSSPWVCFFCFFRNISLGSGKDGTQNRGRTEHLMGLDEWLECPDGDYPQFGPNKPDPRDSLVLGSFSTRLFSSLPLKNQYSVPLLYTSTVQVKNYKFNVKNIL
jgi:hypothetical protein